MANAQWDIDCFEIVDADNTASIITGRSFVCCLGAISNSLKMTPSSRSNAAEQASVEVSKARMFTPIDVMLLQSFDHLPGIANQRMVRIFVDKLPHHDQ